MARPAVTFGKLTLKEEHMTDTGAFHYFDPRDTNPPPVPINLDVATTRRLYQIAEWYARILKANGHEPPADPLRCLIDAGESLIAAVQSRDKLLREHGIDPDKISTWTTLQ